MPKSLAIVALVVLSQTDAPPTSALKPRPLRQGDTIALVAPGSPLDAVKVRAAAENLRQRGYLVKLPRHSGPEVGYLAGSDAARARDLHDLFRDSQVRAIVCVRGGYGSPRLLDLIDYDLVRRHPKILVGYSDITALQLALQRTTGLVVFHGPMAKEWSTPRGLTPFSEKYYWEVFRPTSQAFQAWGAELGQTKTMRPGVAEGRLVGGNLSVICSLLGTPYAIDTSDAILFLEDVGEKLFRLDRMLNQLRLSGRFRQLRGVLLGTFALCETRHGNLDRAEVFEDYFGNLGVPVVTDYPAGHTADNVILPLGVRVRLDAGARRLSLLEAAVSSE